MPNRSDFISVWIDLTIQSKMVNTYERCNTHDENNTPPITCREEQVFFPPARPAALPPIAEMNGITARNGNSSPMSPAPYYSTITSTMSRSRNYRPGSMRKNHRRAVFKNG